MKYITTILPLVFSMTFSYAQELHYGHHLVNRDSTLARNHVKSLIVKNCIGSACMEVLYKFNSQGRITKLAPEIIDPYSTWEYYPDGRIKAEYSKNHSWNSDTLFASIHYEYKANDSLKHVIYRRYENGLVIKADTLERERKYRVKNYPTVLNAKGQVAEQTLGDLYYPCDVTFKGTHKIQYHYLENGLIDHAKIYDEQNELIVDLKYEYEKEL